MPSPFQVFDVETRSLPREQLDAIKPEFKAAKHLKSAEAINNDLADKERDFYEKAALSPLTGSLVVIGLLSSEGERVFLEGEERDICTQFWALFTEPGQQDKFCFWSGSGNSRAFDPDYIVTRSRILGVRVPAIVRNGRYYNPRLVDLAAEFLLHANDAYLSLSNAAVVLGLFREDCSLVRKSKQDEVTGANFAKWYDGIMDTTPRRTMAEQRMMALQYLANDLGLAAAIARRIL